MIRNIDIINNMNANLTQKASLGITGHPNYSGNDGSIMRFGWKAQVRSTLLMSANQMNVEMGVTNETFPNGNRPDLGLRSQSPARNVDQLPARNPDRNVSRDRARTEYFIQWMNAADSRRRNHFHQEWQDAVYQRGLCLLPHDIVRHASYFAPRVVEHHHQSLF